MGATQKYVVVAGGRFDRGGGRAARVFASVTYTFIQNIYTNDVAVGLPPREIERRNAPHHIKVYMPVRL